MLDVLADRTYRHLLGAQVIAWSRVKTHSPAHSMGIKTGLGIQFRE